jgi:hypothetical protein
MPITNDHGPMQLAILYARVPTDEQARTGFSLRQHVDALRTYLTGKGCGGGVGFARRAGER